MATKRKRITITLTITAPASMPARAIRREIMTRINDVTGHYDEWQLNLPGSAWNGHGHVKVRAAVSKRAAADA